MLNAVTNLLRRLGLISDRRALTDHDRRTIMSMLEAGIEPADLTAVTEYTLDDIESARAGDVLTGQSVSAVSPLASSSKSGR